MTEPIKEILRDCGCCKNSSWGEGFKNLGAIQELKDTPEDDLMEMRASEPVPDEEEEEDAAAAVPAN